MTVSANEIDTLFKARQSLSWLGIEKKQLKINSYAHLNSSRRTEFNLTSFLPLLHLNKTDLCCINTTQQCSTTPHPLSAHF